MNLLLFTRKIVKQSIVVPVVLVENRTTPITTGFASSPRKFSFGSIDFAVIAYPSPLSRLAIFFQADVIFSRFHSLDSISQEFPFLFTFNRNKIAFSIVATSPTFCPIKCLRSRVFMKRVTRFTKDKEVACPSQSNKSRNSINKYRVSLFVNFSLPYSHGKGTENDYTDFNTLYIFSVKACQAFGFFFNLTLAVAAFKPSFRVS